MNCFNHSQKKYHKKSRRSYLIPRQSFDSLNTELCRFLHQFWQSVDIATISRASWTNRDKILANIQLFVDIVNTSHFACQEWKIRRTIWIGYYKNIANKNKCYFAKLPKDVISIVLSFVGHNLETIKQQRVIENEIKNAYERVSTTMGPSISSYYKIYINTYNIWYPFYYNVMSCILDYTHWDNANRAVEHAKRQYSGLFQAQMLSSHPSGSGNNHFSGINSTSHVVNNYYNSNTEQSLIVLKNSGTDTQLNAPNAKRRRVNMQRELPPTFNG